MWKNHLVVAYRNLLKHRVFSLVNILGLSLGMLACLLILQYVQFEWSFDRFHEKADRVYRIQHDRFIDGELQYQKAQTFIPTGEAMTAEFPEVENYTTLFRISSESDIVMMHQTEAGETLRFSEKEVYHVKGDFFDVFSFPIVEGTKDIKGLQPNTALVSQSTALKYFGNESPIGKIISHNYAENYQIVGVFEDIPANSHINMDFLFAWQELTNSDDGGDMENWRWDGFYTYLLLEPQTDVLALESKFPGFVTKYNAGQVNEKTGTVFHLQALTDIHLHSDLLAEVGVNNEARIVYALLALAAFVMLMAWINFINLSASRSLDRSREVGVRKVIGSGRIQIINQFLTESLLVNLVALVVSCILIQLLHYYLLPLVGIEFTFTLFHTPLLWIVAGILILLGSLAAGLYPAFVISSFKPITALKGTNTRLSKTSIISTRQVFVIFQFVISICLIASSLVAYRQLGFMKAKDLGIDIKNTVVINTQATFGPPGSDSLFVKNIALFKDKLEAYEKITGVTASYDIPGKEHLSMMPNFRHSKNFEELVTLYFTTVDGDFIPTFDVNLVAGRNFIDNVDKQYSMILNQEAIQVLGFEDPQEAIGREVLWGNQNLGKAEIIGVVDFRAASYKQTNYPIAYNTTFFPSKYISINFNKSHQSKSKDDIGLIKDVWTSVFPNKPFDYFFLEDQFHSHYQADQKFGKLLTAFTFLSILVACLGLYAIASLTVTQRTKEIGIRKTLGATGGHLAFLLSKSFAFLIFGAGILSIPIIKFGTNSWLENYPYRVEVSWWIYLFPVILILLLTSLTIGQQIFRAAFINPSKLLRYE